jgi:hypothetical protein
VTATSSAAQAGSVPSPDRPAPSDRALQLALTGLTAAAVAAFQFVLIDRGGFWSDDFVNLAEARRLGLSPALMTEPVYQHFAPGHRVLDWLVAVPFGESYTAAVLILAAFVFGAVFMFVWLLDECFGRRRIHIVLAAAAGASWILTDTGGWFAAAAHSLPSIFFSLFSLYFYVLWYRRRKLRHYLVALVMFAVDLMFWELSLLVLGEALLLTVLVLAPRRPRAMAAELVKLLPWLVPFVALALGYVIYVNAQPWHQPFDSPTAAELRDFTRIFLLRGWLLPLGGTGTGFVPLTGFQRAMEALAAGAVVGCFALALARRRAVVRGLAWMGLTFFAVWFATAFYRLHSATPWVGDTGRLITPLPFLFWTGVAIMLEPARGPLIGALPRLRTALPAPLRRFGPIAAIVLLSAYAANLVATNNELSFARDAGLAGTERSDRIAAGVRAAQRLGWLSHFVEGPVPDLVAFPGRWDDTLWRMGALWSDGIHAVGSGRPLLTIDGIGAVRDAVFVPAQLMPGQADRTCATSSCTIRLAARHPLSSSAYAYVRVTITTRGPTRLVLHSAPAPAPQDPVEYRRGFDDTTRHLLLSKNSYTLVLPLWAMGVRSATVNAIGSPSTLQAQLGVIQMGPKS